MSLTEGIGMFVKSKAAKELKESLSTKCFDMDEYLVKLLVFPEHSAKDYWANAIYGYLHKVQRFPRRSTYPSYKLIREGLAVNEDMIGNYILLALGEFDSFTKRGSLCNTYIESAVVEYHNWLATELASKGFVTKYEMYNELAGLVNRGR